MILFYENHTAYSSFVGIWIRCVLSVQTARGNLYDLSEKLSLLKSVCFGHMLGGICIEDRQIKAILDKKIQKASGNVYEWIGWQTGRHTSFISRSLH